MFPISKIDTETRSNRAKTFYCIGKKLEIWEGTTNVFVVVEMRPLFF